ncbi:MAG: M20/M25/M40 family metallo-hydrolase [Bacteroidales bacterium]|nr:M20/M25/M40 family metallo-hydrolase [Bacteroidales bacterium]
MNDKELGKLTAEAVALLREMVAVPSCSFEENDVRQLLASRLAERGLNCGATGNNIVCRSREWSGSMKTLMLCAHMDTVPAAATYTFDAFNPDGKQAAARISELRNESLAPEQIVAGLGSNDDGASVVALSAVFQYFEGRKLPFNLLLAISCEEERSGPGGMRHLWGNVVNPDWAIVGEPTCMRAATSERGLLVLDGTAYGVAGHAARGEGVNALYIALEDMMKLRNHRFTRISPRMGEVKMTVTQVNAGTAHNVIPDRCDFVVDIRPTEMYTNSEILEELQAMCSSELKARNLLNCSSATFEGSPLAATLETMGIETFSSPTTSDWMRLRCDAIKMGPGDSSRSHKADEYVLVDEIEKAIKQYVEFIENFSKAI